jgi:hypothetical protein
MSLELRKGVIFEGVAGTPDRDVVRQVLDIGGADITDLKENRGFVDSDHMLHKKGTLTPDGRIVTSAPGNFSSLVGRIIDADKIMKESDAKTERQKIAWKKHRKPFIWVSGELFDGHGHMEADSIASIYRFYQDRGLEPPIKLSVEGRTLELDKTTGLLKRTQIRGVAMTVHPCNRATHTEVVSMLKSAGHSSDLVKSEDYIAPEFIEHTTSNAEKIYELSRTALELIKKARAVGPTISRPLYKSVALERLRGLKAQATF